MIFNKYLCAIFVLIIAFPIFGIEYNEQDSTLSVLTQDLTSFGMKEALLSSVADLNDSSHAIIFGDDDTFSQEYPAGTYPSIVRATFAGTGRVVAMGQECYASIGLTEQDNMQFILNAICFLDVKNTKRVLIDKGHSDWLDLSYGLIDSLESHGYAVEKTVAKLNSSALDGFGVLILGNCWGDYMPMEYSSVENFIKSGNGLFVMGLGWSWVTYHSDKSLEDYPMNQFAMKFGLKFVNDNLKDFTNNIDGVDDYILFHSFYPDVPDIKEPPSRPYRILIDQSHDYSFLWDWKMGSEYMSRVGVRYTRNMATLDSTANSDLLKYDAFMIPQVWSNAEFLPEEIEQIKLFVERGGGLLLVGSPLYFPDSLDYPMNNLAKEFGVSFHRGGNILKVFRIKEHEITKNVNEYVTESTSLKSITVPSDWDTLITDSQDRIVASAGTYGAGRVIATCDVQMINFAGNINQTLIGNMAKWLTVSMNGADSSFTPPERKYPENVLTQNLITYRYARNLVERINFLYNNYDSVTTQLKKMMSVDCVYNLNIIALATGGGGYSSGSEVGIGLLTGDPFALAVFAHEMTHSWQQPGGEVPWMGEGWAILSAERVCQHYGGEYEQWAVNERQGFMDLFYQYDPMGKTIDITEYGTERMSVPNGVYTGKCFWLLENLESQYGSDLMNRYFRLRRKYYDPALHGAITTQKIVYFLSWAAGQELFTYFKRKRTLVESVPVYPVVFYTTPENGDTLNSNISIVFNAHMDSTTLNSETVKVTGSVSGNIEYRYIYTDSSQSLTLFAMKNLSPSEIITVEITNGAKDIWGMPLDGNGDRASSAIDSYKFQFIYNSTTTVKDAEGMSIPMKFHLDNYPNPFNSQTRFRISIPERDIITIKVRNLLGQTVDVLVTEKKCQPGIYDIQWQPNHLPTGVYILSYESQKFHSFKKILYLK